MGIIEQYMPSKRVSRGRRKGGKGSTGVVQCTNCGQTVPKDKAKKVTSRLSLVEHQLAKELRAQGTYIASPTILKWYCISCAIHFKILKIRSSSKEGNILNSDKIILLSISNVL